MAEIRRAGLADAHGIAAVHRLSRADYYGVPPDEDDDREAMWEHFLSQPETIAHVVADAEEIIGVLSAHHTHDPSDALQMTALYVLPGRFGQGVGSRLHDVFEEERSPHEAGVLEVWAGNRRAIEFYLRRGWTVTSRTRPGPLDHPYVTYRLAARSPETPGPGTATGS